MADAAAAAAAAAADANAADFLAAADGHGDDNGAPNLAAAINGIMADLGSITDRLNALEHQAEQAALGDAAAPPAGAGVAPVAGGVANAAGGPPPPPAGGDAGLAGALADGIARAIRESRRGRRSVSSSDDDDDSRTPTSSFTDQRARRCVTRGEPLVYFQLPPSARTSFPAPYRMETLRYRDDFPPSEPCAEADEAKHLTIIGAWSSSMHNELLAFTDSAGYGDVKELQGLLLRSRVYHHQLAELCAARYDVLKEPDAAIAAQLQERMLAPADTHASKVRRTLEVETHNLRDRGLNKSIAAQQIKDVAASGRRRGRRGRRTQGEKGDGGNPSK